MKQTWVRPAELKDAEQLALWSVANVEKNELDPAVLRYPQTSVLVAHDGKPVTFMPVQLVAMIESLASRPGVTPLQLADALKELLKTVVFLSKKQGVHEVYFLGTDEAVTRMAQRHAGFEELPWKAYRLKIDRLEDDSNLSPQDN